MKRPETFKEVKHLPEAENDKAFIARFVIRSTPTNVNVFSLWHLLMASRPVSVMYLQSVISKTWRPGPGSPTAPFFVKKLTMSMYPSVAAMERGVKPRLSSLLISIPFPTSNMTTSKLPQKAAM